MNRLNRQRQRTTKRQPGWVKTAYKVIDSLMACINAGTLSFIQVKDRFTGQMTTVAVADMGTGVVPLVRLFRDDPSEELVPPTCDCEACQDTEAARLARSN